MLQDDHINGGLVELRFQKVYQGIFEYIDVNFAEGHALRARSERAVASG